MTIQDTSKTDILWKKVIYGVTETSSGKAATEESIISPAAILSTQVWQQANLIPIPAASLSGIVTPVSLQLVADASVTSNQAWIAVSNPSLTSPLLLASANRILNFVPFTVDSTYVVNVYSDAAHTNKLMASQSGSEWVFDYSAGILYFINALPAGVTTVYLTGYIYVGNFGVGSSGGGNGTSSIGSNSGTITITGDMFGSGVNTINVSLTSSTTAGTYNQVVVNSKGLITSGTFSSISANANSGLFPATITYTTGITPIITGAIVDFTLTTGPYFFINSVTINATSKIECHSTSFRNDPNPYVFVANSSWINANGNITPWLTDNGTFAVDGIIYYGNSNILMQILENPSIGKSYWRITNTSNITLIYNLSISILGFSDLSNY